MRWICAEKRKKNRQIRQQQAAAESAEMVRLIGIEPTLSAPEADALSTELQAHKQDTHYFSSFSSKSQGIFGINFVSRPGYYMYYPTKNISKKILNFVLLKFVIDGIIWIAYYNAMDM